MKTEALIDMLARGPIAADTGTDVRRYATAIGWGGLGAMILMAILLGVRPDLVAALSDPMFWVKLGFVTVLAIFCVPANLRLARPGARLGRVRWGMAAPVLLIWLLAVLVLAQAPQEARPALIWGRTWSACPLNISILSVPAFVMLMWAMKGLAPTAPRTAGAAVGLLAGAIGAMAYTLHCPEMAAPFLAIWYVIGVMVPTVLGAILGPWLLRW